MNAGLDFTHRFVPGEPAAPVLLLLHGTGGNEHDLLDLGRQLRPGAALLSPRGKVLENGMPRFFRRLAEGVFDQRDLVARTHELADFVQAASGEYAFGSRKIIAVGYSNGANVAAAMLLLRPEVLSGAVLLRAMVPLAPETLPDLSRVPVFLAAGREDPLVPGSNSEQLARLLEDAGADVALEWAPGGHSISPAELETARIWLAENFPNS